MLRTWGTCLGCKEAREAPSSHTCPRHNARHPNQSSHTFSLMGWTGRKHRLARACNRPHAHLRYIAPAEFSQKVDVQDMAMTLAQKLVRHKTSKWETLATPESFATANALNCLHQLGPMQSRSECPTHAAKRTRTQTCLPATVVNDMGCPAKYMAQLVVSTESCSSRDVRK